MREELLQYYNRELDFLRRMSVEFAGRHPEEAGRLQLGSGISADPHVERLLEGFALIAGRIQLKLDDQFPEISMALLNVLYPHYLSPIPAMSVVQFSQPAGGNLAAGQVVESGTRLQSPPVQATKCWFRTCYPATLWPIEVETAELHSDSPPERERWAEAAIRLKLKCAQQTPLAKLRLGAAEESRPIDSLRFFINGDRSLTYPLYELIFNHATRVELRPASAPKRTGKMPKPATIAPINLPASCLKPVGFGLDEGMLPYTGRSFIGYRLLTEYFAFPEKFLFFDVTGLERAAAAGFGDQFEIWIHLKDVKQPEGTVHKDTFLLGCTPVVNLFEKTTEPILLSHEKTEYAVVPDIGKQATTEVYSVDEVEVVGGDASQVRRFQPFYALSHTFGNKPDEAYWYAMRNASTRENIEGTEVSLMFVDRRFNPTGVGKQRAIVRTTCTNRDLPNKRELDWTKVNLTIMGPLALWRARCINQPTQAIWPALQRGAHWRLLSHLTLNYLSLGDVERDGSPEALREILRLYDFSQPGSKPSQTINRQIDGITTLRGEPAIGRLPGAPIGAGYVRGLRTTIEFDERQYSGGSVFLFASVLERFLSLYVSVNSFNQLVALNKLGKLKQWDPRTGEQKLL